MKLVGSVEKTSIKGISLFKLRKHDDKILSTVSVSMDTKIAEYLVDLVNIDQGYKKNINYRGVKNG